MIVEKLKILTWDYDACINNGK